MGLDGAFGETQLAADEFVGLALHHEPQHVYLPFREAQIGRLDRLGGGGGPRRGGHRRGAVQHGQRKVDTLGEDQTQRAHHHLAGRGFGDETHGTPVKRFKHRGAVVAGRKDHHGHVRMFLAQNRQRL